MPLEIISSNRLEVLGDHFIERISAAPLAPMAVEPVLVQSRGMARWLNLRLAVAHNIAAGIEYLFPNNFIDQLLHSLMPEGSEPVLRRRDLAWQVAAVLDRGDPDPEVMAYVRASGLHRLQLAFALADRFDQYTVYRADMIAAWEAGDDDHWQARLWRRIRDKKNQAGRCPHRGEMLARLRDMAADSTALGTHLPERLAIFGVSSLPLFHIEVLAAIADNCRVSFYLLNPSRQLWDYIAGRRQVSRLTRGLSVDPAEFYLEGHNNLLASLGAQGAELFRLLRRYDPLEEELFPVSRPVPAGDPLRLLQEDILDDVSDPEPISIRAADLRPTISFHDCSGRMREVEVLREELCALFADDPELGAADVAVMVPDIAAYAPLVDAVFGDGREPEIPYAIADRPLVAGHGLLAAFMDLLDLGRNRFRLSAVMALLEKEPVRNRFSLSEAEVGMIASWFDDAGVRWGIDPTDRESRGLPSNPENSWQAGIDRLLMGYATGIVPGCATVAGVAPLRAFANAEAELVGRAVAAVDTIFAVCREFAVAAAPGCWSERLRRMIDLCLAPGGEEEAEFASLLELMDSLAAGEAYGLSTKLSIDEIVSFFSREISGERRTGGFLSGRLTFCELLPMRSIPFEVICLLGMDYDAFPRRDRFGSLDLMAANPRPGDRSRRQDDRYLFLEILISARSRIYLSFVGRDCSSNTQRPPSVLLSELGDYLDRRFIINDRDDTCASAILSYRHPVSPWSPLAFDPAAPASFSCEDLECARTLGKGIDTATIFAGPDLGGEDRPKELSLDDLLAFFINPARHFCRNVLHLTLPEAERGHGDLESFSISPFAGHDLDRRILETLTAGLAADTCLERVRSEGILPHGPRGEKLFRARARVLERLDRQRRSLAPGAAEMLPVTIMVNGTAIKGEIEVYGDNRVVTIRRGVIRGREFVGLWLRVLVLAVAVGRGEGVMLGVERQSVRNMRLAMPPDPAVRLAEMVDIFHRGSERVLPFFPDAAMVMVEKEAKGKDRGHALAAARKKYRSSRIGGWGEADDRWVRFCFQDDDPLGPEFIGLARQVFNPILEARIL